MIDEINDYQPLCDIKNCENPQSGEIYELPILGVGVRNLVARIHPCSTHVDVLNIIYKPN